MRKTRLDRGRFRLGVPLGAELRWERIRLDEERLTRCRTPQTHLIEGPTELELIADWPQDHLLRVVDAATGKDLREVTVLENTVRGSRRFVRPPLDDSARQILKGADSPLSFPVRTHSSVLYWCHAPGHAWGRIILDDQSEGVEQVLSLPRTARLDVRVHNPPVREQAFLRLRLGDALDRWRLAFEADCPEVGSPLTLDDLQPDSFRVSVEIGEASRDPLVLGQLHVDLQPDSQQTVELNLDDIPTIPNRAPLGGTLSLPLDWGPLEWSRLDSRIVLEQRDLSAPLRDPLIRLEPDRMTVLDASLGLYGWTAGPMIPGRYRFSVRRFGVGGEFEHLPDGSASPHIAIPPPADVVIEVVEMPGGTPLPVNSVRWRWMETSDARQNATNIVALNPAASRIELRVPAGEVWFDALNRQLGRGENIDGRTVTVRPGRNVVRLEKKPVFALRIELREGDALIRYGFDSRASFESRSDSSGPKYFADDGTSLTYYFQSTGRFRITPGAPEEFWPPAPVEVEIGPGPEQVLEIPLRRRVPLEETDR